MADTVLKLTRVVWDLDERENLVFYTFVSEVAAIEESSYEGIGAEIVTKNCGRILVTEPVSEILGQMGVEP